MALFLLGLAIGGISGGVTQYLTGDALTSLAVGAIVAALCWFGRTIAFIFLDD